MSRKNISGYIIFLDQKLGKGAYGVVYKGQHKDSKRLVAIKAIDKSNIDGDSYLKGALIKEIKVMQTVKSPHIVQLLDVMESPRNYYIIQQLCDIDLQRYLQGFPGNVLSQNQSIRLLSEICTGFLALVKQGIVHRDLKPANIFLSEKRAKIGDFGFAKKQETGLKNQTQVGTPLYMAIQLLKGQPYTSKCDIWALGFIFYEMLHGHTPWTAKSEFQLINNITTKPLRIDEKFSNKTKDFLKKALEPTEDKRLSWQQLYAHQIFNGAFKKEIENKETLQNKFKKVMIDIRIQVNSQNIDLLKLWQNLGYSYEKNLSQQEFKEFISSLVPNIEKGQLQYFFNKMDYNHDGSLSLKEIQTQFKQNKIPFKSQQRIPYLIKKITTLNESINDDELSPAEVELENKVRNAFKKLENTLTKKNLTLYKVFNAYDRDKTGQLSLSQFSEIMSKLKSNITEEEVKLIFDVIDQDKSNSIEFAELNGYYSRINGIPLSFNMSQESVKKSKNS